MQSGKTGSLFHNRGISDSDINGVLASLRRIVAGFTSDPGLQADLIQECLVHLWTMHLEKPGRTRSWYLQSCRFRVQHWLASGRSLDSLKRLNGNNRIVIDGEGDHPALAEYHTDSEVFEQICFQDVISTLALYLKPQERLVLDGLSGGMKLPQIVSESGLSYPTVLKYRRHIAALTRKLGICETIPREKCTGCVFPRLRGTAVNKPNKSEINTEPRVSSRGRDPAAPEGYGPPLCVKDLNMLLQSKLTNACALLLLLAGVWPANGETPPQFFWAQHAGGGGDDRALAVTLDPARNVLVTGVFSGTAIIGSSNFVSAGLEDIFLAKYDSAGNFLWARQAGGTGDDYGLGVAADTAGDVYLTGSFQNTATFGPTNLTASGTGKTRLSDVFVAKYDSSGNLIWVSRAGGSGSDQANAIALDPQGNAYITGSFDANATFGSTSLVNTTGADNIFVAKINSTGNFLWALKAGDSNTNNVGNGIALDGGTNVYVTGYFAGTATFGGTNLASSGANGLPDVFLAKYDSGGNLVWVLQAGGTGDDRGNAVAVDAAGNISLTGQFAGTAAFGGTNLVANGSGPDIFVARYGSAGNLLWARRAGGNSAIYGDSGFGIATDAGSNAFVTGYFSGNASFGPTNLTSVGFQDIFCSKYDAAGNLLWVRHAGGVLGNDFGYGVASDRQGNVFLAGFFLSSTITFDSVTLTNTGGRDAFLAALRPAIVPSLSITTSNGQLLLSWPAAATGFGLQSATDLPATTWIPVPATPNVIGSSWLVTLPPTNAWSYFRLIK